MAIFQTYIREYGFDPDDFKTILFALNKVNSKRIVDHVINQLTGYSGETNIYDMIAWFFCNQFIDGIINFNFDELLDSSIKNQIQYSEREWRVFSEDSCSEYMKLRLPRSLTADLPVYIKPHGTISAKASLRFARPDFYRIQPLQERLIGSLLNRKNLTIVTVGFRLKFFEFSTMIKKYGNDSAEIIIIDMYEDILDQNIKCYYKGNFLRVSDSFRLYQILACLKEKVFNSTDMAKLNIHDGPTLHCAAAPDNRG